MMQVTPEEGTQFRVGSSEIYLIEVSEPNEFGWTWLTGHDDNGEEVTIRMVTVSREEFIEEMGYDPDDL